MSLRAKFFVYLAALHGAAAILAYRALGSDPSVLLPIEIALAISFALGVALVGRLFRPLELVRAGAEYIAEREFMVRFVSDGDPDVERLIAVYNEMVDSLREERARLREQDFFLDRVLEALPSGVLTLDHDARIAMLNPAAERLLGISSLDAAGARLCEIASPLARALAELEQDEARVISLSGGRRVKSRRSQFFDRGFPRGFFLLEEVTEELRRSERAAYEKLIRTLSHEVNNSAGAVGSLLESCRLYGAQLTADDQVDFEEALAVAISRTQQLAAFMAGFADVVRLPPPKREPVDVCVLLEAVGRLMHAECERRRIRWIWHVRERIPPIPMDRAQMEQVFVNVVKNAIEATGEDGDLRVILGEDGGAYFAAIEDTGPGLAPGADANLFTPFFSTKEHGQGIGLTLSREVLDAHGFECSLVGPPGGPTRFTVRF